MHYGMFLLKITRRSRCHKAAYLHDLKGNHPILATVIRPPHATALLVTEDQARNNKSQTVHIYRDANHNYTSHTLYEERDDKTLDA